MNQSGYTMYYCSCTTVCSSVHDSLSSSFEYKCICIPCLLGLPRMVVIRDYSGIPCPHCGPPLSIHAGDVIELMFADLHSSWWQVRVTQLMLVLSQHLWLYEKITCYGSPARLGARKVFGVSWVWIRAACHLFSLSCWMSHYLTKKKAFKNIGMGWHQQFVSLWPLLFINHKWYCGCLSHSASRQVSHKCDDMMRSESIRNISRPQSHYKRGICLFFHSSDWITASIRWSNQLVASVD